MNNDACYSKESWINHSVNNLLSKASTKPIRFPLSNIGFNNSILIKNKKAMKVAKVSHTIQWIANVYRVKYYRTTTAQNRNLCSCVLKREHTPWGAILLMLLITCSRDCLYYINKVCWNGVRCTFHISARVVFQSKWKNKREGFSKCVFHTLLKTE